MKRRNFIKKLAVASVGTPILLDQLKFQAHGQRRFNIDRSAEDRVLVIIRLNGGNDGLNTIIPRDQYSNLSIQRSNVLIPENDVLALTNDVGLHPAMTGMQNMYNDGKLGIIQSVAYPEQNRSHFRSMDIWTSGLIDASPSTGWLGRPLDMQYPNYPSDYPSIDCPDPFAISMGYEVSATCQGLMANFSHAVDDPTDIYTLTDSSTTNDGTYYGDHMEFLSTLIDQSNAYGSQINNAVTAGNTLSNLYDNDNPLAVHMRYIAQMISGGLKSNIYILNINGFDTHDAQVDPNDTTTGTHANLLTRLSDAVAAFQDDLNLLGLEERVVGMTFSEFGRQIASNASNGTDHGDAAPLMLFGTCLSTSIMGNNPTVSSNVINQAGIPMQFDFRDIYASILKDWFGVSTTDIDSFFEHQVNYYSIVGACTVGIEEETIHKNAPIAFVYPNPVSDNATVQFDALDEWVKIDVYDMNQKLVSSIYNGNLSQATHHIPMSLDHLESGQYFVMIQKESGSLQKQFIKVG